MSKAMADSAASPGATTFKAVVLHTEDFPEDPESGDAARTRVLWLAPDDPDCKLPEYQAGQYAMLHFPGFPPRPYSIANAPNGKFLEFHIRRTGSGASHYATHDLKKDDIIDVSAPYGECVFIETCTKPLIAVAGGTGLATMKAIVEKALSIDMPRDVFLYHGVRTLDDIYLEDFFIDLMEEDERFHYIPVLSDEKIEGLEHGLVAPKMAADFPSLAEARIYTAGPLEMVRHVIESSLKAGATADHIHSDYSKHDPKGGVETDEE